MMSPNPKTPNKHQKSLGTLQELNVTEVWGKKDTACTYVPPSEVDASMGYLDSAMFTLLLTVHNRDYTRGINIPVKDCELGPR